MDVYWRFLPRSISLLLAIAAVSGCPRYALSASMVLGVFTPINTYTKAKPITFHQTYDLRLSNHSNSQDFAEPANKILAAPTGSEPKGLWGWSSCKQLSAKVERLAAEEEVTMWTAEERTREKQFWRHHLMPEDKANTGLFKFITQEVCFFITKNKLTEGYKIVITR